MGRKRKIILYKGKFQWTAERNHIIAYGDTADAAINNLKLKENE